MSRAARSAAPEPVAPIALAGPGLAGEVAAVLAARGLSAAPIERAGGERAGGAADRDRPAADAAALPGALARGAVIGWAADAALELADAAALAPGCEAGARAGRPVVILAPAGRAGRGAAARAAALAHVLAAGAVVVDDPDVWIEALVLVAAIGVPAGPRAAVVAAPGGWIDRAARALAAEAEARGGRGPAIAAGGDDLDPVDAVLLDAQIAAPAAPRARALIVPVLARAELAGAGAIALTGVRNSLAAVIACGRAAERAAAGLGPAPRDARATLEIDEARLERQLAKVAPDDARIGDHEAKVLLAAYGVPITRQAVATTPSAAIRIAKKAGYPVELKPWGADVPTERAGCPVEKNVGTASEVRRAYLAVLGAAGLPVSESEGDGAAVIVREAPPPGREITAVFAREGALGWTCLVEVAGAAPIAAPAPLRLVDAERLAAAVASTRAGEAEPDRAGLANLLRRASHLAVDHADRFTRVELGRVVIGARGGRTVVVDAAIELA